MRIFNRTIKTSFQLTAVIALLLVPNACNDFLNEAPDNRVTLDNLDKAAQLLTSAYSIASPAFTDWMTDNSGYIREVTLRQSHERAYAWEDFIDDPNELDTPSFFWQETYNAIAHANEVLAALETFPAKTETEKKRKRAVEAEARLARAYGHFMLVNLFSKHYDENKAESDKGVPYVETPETVFIKTYKRNTVKEVYNKVEADMLKGIELIDDTFFNNSGKYHFNKNAGLAFASRFYLFKGDFDKCIEYSTLMLGSDPGSYVRDMTSAEFQNASSSPTAYPQLYSSPQQRGNLLLMRKISLVQRLDFAHGPTNDIYDDIFDANPFGGTDERENPSYQKGENGGFPARYESLFERSSLNSNVGTPYHIGIMFRGEEVLLNRAEALAEKNRITEAMADLQTLANKRYSGASTITINDLRSFFGVGGFGNVSNRSVVIEWLIRERRREFFVQGMRWFDIKRFEISVKHTLEDGSIIELKKDDLRKVLQIPKSAIDVGGLTSNPR